MIDKIDKIINFLDVKVMPFIESTKTYKKYEALAKYEIYPINNGERTIRLLLLYEESDYDGFTEFPLINLEFIIKDDKIRLRKKIKECPDICCVYLPAKEKKELMKMIKDFKNEYNKKQ